MKKVKVLKIDKKEKRIKKIDEKEPKYQLDDEVSYLETCTYYKKLQNAVSKLVKFISPNYMVELGCGNGNTTVRLALENPMTSIVALEIVKERVENSSISAKNRKVRNITFVQGDFTKLKNFNLKNCGLVMMMYSFTWILDPLKNKIDFLKGLYDNLSEGAYILIADTFLLSKEGTLPEQLERLFYARKKESKEEAFWENLSGLSGKELSNAKSSICKAETNEDEIYKDAQERTQRCFVARQWLSDTATKIGYKVLISEYVNGLNDGVVLLKK